MLEFMLIGQNTVKNCGRILKKSLSSCSDRIGIRYPKPYCLQSLSSGKQELILLHRKEPEEYWCVLSSDDENAVHLAQKQKWRTLTCGYSSYDTLVLSSRSTDCLLVSLQREMYTVTNRLLEAGDYLVSCTQNNDEQSILFCVAALLLLDTENEEHLFIF